MNTAVHFSSATDLPRQYNLIYADPAWTYRDKCHAGERGAGYKYDLMTLPEICALPVREIAADDCLLAMWWVGPQPAEALAVVNAWGFTLKTMKGFSWHKLTKNGKSHFGMGNWSRANTEDCLFATRGRPKRVNAGVRQFLEEIENDDYLNETIGRHSEKPAEARRRLELLLGDVPRVELFARQKHAGWDAWGNEVENSINLQYPPPPVDTGAFGSMNSTPDCSI
jgi:N6-adenosine-specific RNA methylase IME4